MACGLCVVMAEEAPSVEWSGVEWGAHLSVLPSVVEGWGDYGGDLLVWALLREL